MHGGGVLLVEPLALSTRVALVILEARPVLIAPKRVSECPGSVGTACGAEARGKGLDRGAVYGTLPGCHRVLGTNCIA